MLYLEDYLELIEHLPQELRDRFTDIREQDLQVQNSSEQLKEKVKLFFAGARKLEPEQRQCDYEKLVSEYQATMKYADGKMQMADQMHEIMIKLVQRLDAELEKFKLELEADHAGITEELEKRSLELDLDSRLDDISLHLNHSATAESGHYGTNLSSFGNNSSFKNSSFNKNNLQNITTNLPFSQQHSALSAALASTNPQLNSVSALALMNASSVHNKISNSIKSNDLINDSSSPLVRQNPLVAAASQAIAATQQLQQGRRTPSLKASFAAISAAGLGSLDSFSNKQDASAGNNRNALAPMAPDQQAFRYSHQYGKINASANGNSNPLYISVSKSDRATKRPRHHASHIYPDETPTSISSDNSVFENSESLSSTDFIEAGTTFGSNSPSSLDFATNNTQGNTTLYRRDETKYCVCRQISYGEMVACDNDECEIEWFHYDCVDITQPPKGKWFCPDCTRRMVAQQHQHQPQTQKKRGRKEKSLFDLVNSIDAVRSKDRVSEQSKNII